MNQQRNRRTQGTLVGYGEDLRPSPPRCSWSHRVLPDILRFLSPFSHRDSTQGSLADKPLRMEALGDMCWEHFCLDFTRTPNSGNFAERISGFGDEVRWVKDDLRHFVLDMTHRNRYEVALVVAELGVCFVKATSMVSKRKSPSNSTPLFTALKVNAGDAEKKPASGMICLSARIPSNGSSAGCCHDGVSSSQSSSMMQGKPTNGHEGCSLDVPRRFWVRFWVNV